MPSPRCAAARGVDSTTGGDDRLAGDQSKDIAAAAEEAAIGAMLPPPPSLSAEAVAVLANLTVAQVQRKIRVEGARWRVCSIVRVLGARLTALADECKDADANLAELRLLFAEAAGQIREATGDV